MVKRALTTRRRILLAGLVPLVLFTAMLAYFLVWDHLQVQQRNFEQLGESYTRELAAAARYGLFVLDEAELRELAGSFIHRKHVHGVEIQSSGNRLTIIEGHSAPDGREDRFLRSYTEKVLPQPVIAIEEDPAFAGMVSAEMAELPGLGAVTVTLTSRDAKLEAQNLILKSLGLLLGGLLLATGLLWRASRKIAKPIESITDLVRQAADGQFDQRAHTGAQDELARLERGVNAMLDTLQQHHQELQQRIANATAELQTRNLQLEQARHEALQASRAKSEFLAHMSHEIRTPMNGILGFVELLGQEPLEESQKTKLEFIRDSARELMTVLDQVLDFSRIEAGRTEVAREPLDIRRMAASVCHLLMPEAVDRGLECRLEISESVPALLIGDPTRLRQILSNLVSNAIKYTPSGSVHISIDAEVLPRAFCGLTLTVEDTGIGIAEEDLERIFEPFTQVAIGNRRQYQGTGLGLAIVRRLADAVNADIQVKSTPGKGSRFEVRLRLPVAAITQPLPKQAEQGSDDGRLAGIRVLAVDDNRVNRHLLEAMLQVHGADVRLASDGMEAVATAAREHFDVILMDIHMPGMGGIEASREIRSLDGYAQVPIFAISADAVSQARIELEMPDLAGYLIKPVEELALVQAIDDCVRGRSHTADGPPATQPVDSAAEPVRPLRDQSILLMFIDDLQAELAAIDAAFSDRDWTRLREALHGLKGAAAVCSAERIFAAANAMQEAIQSDDMASAKACLARLHEAAREMIKENRG
jgi:two-component system, sensor histidine kinase